MKSMVIGLCLDDLHDLWLTNWNEQSTPTDSSSTCAIPQPQVFRSIQNQSKSKLGQHNKKQSRGAERIKTIPNDSQLYKSVWISGTIILSSVYLSKLALHQKTIHNDSLCRTDFIIAKTELGIQDNTIQSFICTSRKEIYHKKTWFLSTIHWDW